MSYWIIKLDDTCNILSDFTSQGCECPQWYYMRDRAYRFGDVGQARAFWSNTVASFPAMADQRPRYVRIVSTKDRREQVAKLLAAIREAHRNLPTNPHHARNVLGATLATTATVLPGDDGAPK